MSIPPIIVKSHFVCIGTIDVVQGCMGEPSVRCCVGKSRRRYIGCGLCAGGRGHVLGAGATALTHLAGEDREADGDQSRQSKGHEDDLGVVCRRDDSNLQRGKASRYVRNGDR